MAQRIKDLKGKCPYHEGANNRRSGMDIGSRTKIKALSFPNIK